MSVVDAILQVAGRAAFPRLDDFSFDALFRWHTAGQAAIRRGEVDEATLNAAVYVGVPILDFANLEQGRAVDEPVPKKFAELVKFLYKAIRPKDEVECYDRLRRVTWQQPQHKDDILPTLLAHSSEFQRLAEALDVAEKQQQALHVDSLRGPIGRELKKYRKATDGKTLKELVAKAVEIARETMRAMARGMDFVQGRAAAQQGTGAAAGAPHRAQERGPRQPGWPRRFRRQSGLQYRRRRLQEQPSQQQP